MSAPKIKADFDQLNDIAQTWRKLAEDTRASQANLQTRLNILKNGDWVGESAERFYAEMDSVVMPAFNRMSNALDQASSTTLSIRNAFFEAEIDVSALFKETNVTPPTKNLTLTPQPPPDGSPIPIPVPAPPLQPSIPYYPGQQPPSSETPIPVPVPTPPPQPPIPYSPEPLPEPGHYLPPVVADVADTYDAQLDFTRGIIGSALTTAEEIINAFRDSAGMVKVVPVMEHLIRRTVTTTIVREIEGVIEDFSWRMREIVKTESTFVAQMVEFGQRPLSVFERLGDALKGLFKPSKESFGALFKGYLKEAFSLGEVSATASKVAKIAKWMPLIGLGLDVVADILKYTNRSGNPFEDGEFWGSITKDVLYFGVGGIITALGSALLASVSWPVVLAGIGVAAIALFVDTAPLPDGKTTTQHVIDFFTDKVGNPIANWIKGQNQPAPPLFKPTPVWQ